jgi:hypothetical protein
MAEYTNNYNLEKQQANEYISIEGINDNFDIIDAQMKSNEEAASKAHTDLNEHMKDNMKHIVYAVASGTNTYTAAINGITSLVEGMSIKIKFPNANTGASTLNINGLGAKEIRKSNGNALSSGNIKAGQICHLVYTGSVFQLLGEGGEYGTATPDKVLAGYTIGTESGVVEGTMPNNGPAAADTINLTNQNQEYTIAQGYHSGLRKIKAAISGLAANVIKAGTTVGGIAGTFTSDANAAAGHILSGMTAYVNGNKITGSIPSKGAATYTPGTTNQTIAAGQYLSGAQTIKGDTNLIASNIKSGVQIFGVTGTHVVTFAPGNQVTARHTYDDGTWYTTPIKVAQFKIPVAGTYRVSFNLGAGTNGYNAYGRIYKNGAAYGTLRIVTTYTKVTFTEDLTFNAGDTCELWIYTSNSVVYAYANEFMLLTGIATPYILDVT